jgi:DNA (cytosine-5)-methyltransferase 1
MKIQLSMSEINSIKKNNVKVVSMFSGCGGSSLGYKLNGCSVLLANEFDSKAQEVYSLNHPNTILLKDDIRKISGESILNLIHLKKYELDILDGSPPCSSYSNMGIKQKGWGKEKNYSGKVQRTDDLFFEFSRILKELMPKSFVAENVKGLTEGLSKYILGNSYPTFIKDKTIITILSDIGYNVKFKVLDASNFEVPQKRKRLIIIGIRKDLNIVPTFPKKTPFIITTKQAIEDLIDEGTDYQNSPKRTESIKRYFPPKCSNKDALIIIRKNKLTGIMMYYTTRDKWDKPFQTIIQSGDRAFHPLKDRSLSINECKRLFSFPDDFILPHSPSQNWERLARSVPPNLMKHVSRNLIEILFKGKQNEPKRIVKRIIRRPSSSSK